MAIFNKLGDVARNIGEKTVDTARNIGDKTSEAIETTKLNSKINSEKTAIAECMRQIGAIYYQKYLAGEPVDNAAAEFFAAADGHNRNIADAQAEINKIKGGSTAQAQTASAPTAEGIACTSCGKANPAGTKFCAECGSKIEAPAPAAEENACPGCSAQVAANARFCGNCGYKFE